MVARTQFWLGAHPRRFPLIVDYASLETRLHRLEDSNRLIKRLLAFSALPILGFLFIAARTQSPRVLEAEQFVLKDRNGQIRGQFGISPTGVVSLSVGNISDKAYAVLAVLPGASAQLQLRASPPGRASTWVELAANHLVERRTFLDLVSGQGSALTGTRAEVDTNGESSVYLYKARAQAVQGSPLVSWSRTPRAEIQLTADGQPRLTLYDDSIRVRAILGASALRDESSGEILTRAPASLLLLAPNGRIIWRAP